MIRTNKTLIVSVTAALLLIVARFAIPHFVRPTPYVPVVYCVNNLRQMDGAVQQWMLEYEKKSGDTMVMSNLTPYLRSELQCPQGGHYTIGPAASNGVTCSFPGHVLPP